MSFNGFFAAEDACFPLLNDAQLGLIRVRLLDW